jgi:hypothetical protein
MDGIELEYWDSCTFLALLKNEQHRPGEQTYLQDQARKFDMGALGLVTSLLITFDSENKPAKKEIGLTKLTGSIAGKYQLTICRPQIKKGQQNSIVFPNET